MVAFLLKRLAGGVLTLFVIATLCFFIVRFAPGNPFTGERKLPPEVLRNLERAHNMDKPLLVQYGLRLKGYLTGDLGPSIKYPGKRVEDLLFPSFPKSLQLGTIGFMFAMLLGIPIGIVAAARQNRIPDYVSSSVALIGICIPNFLLGPILVMVFSLSLRWLPVAGWPENFSGEELLKLLLPAVTLGAVHVAYVSRLTRAGMLDVLHKDFIRTARAKGLDERTVFLKHALKNGITPVLSYAGPMAAYIFTGSVVVEKIFNLPGMGQHFVDAALARDDAVVMGAVLIYSWLVIVFNLVVDACYSLLDPRVRPT
ncbi:MAG: ABC transporter permease [Planctomycetota bacterium]|nr:MAG: ABC transporter permease [Planctomycetota bacterium]